MEYHYFLTSLEVNSSKYLFYSKQNFSTSMYKNDNNFDFDLTIYSPEDTEFETMAKDLELRKTHFLQSLKYLTHVPIEVAIQKEYFKSEADIDKVFSKFVNNFLTLYQYFFNSYGIPAFKLDGRIIFHKSGRADAWARLEYKSLNDTDFFEHLKESIVYGEGATDLVCALAAENEPLEFNWTLLLDGIRNFYEGNFRQTFINCCTSVEVTVTEPVRRWLQSLSFTKSSEQINQLIYDVSNPLKFEFYIESINPEPFRIYSIEELKELIVDLKFLNTTRNKVAHNGFDPSVEESKRAIKAASNFLKAIWIFSRKHFYDEMKKR